MEGKIGIAGSWVACCTCCTGIREYSDSVAV